MPTTVIGLYRTEDDVQRVEEDLARQGFPRREINRHDKEDANLRSWLEEQGVPQRDAEDYLLGVRNGGKLVVLEASDDRADEAVEIMRRHELGGTSYGAGTDMGYGAGADVGIDAAMDADRTGGTGWTDADTRGERTRTDRARATGDETVEVVEEDLDIRKREVERGGVNVRSYVTERPVEKEVSVRDETIHVDRRPVDRAVSAADAESAFREQSLSMTETDEEVVVDKRARVIEEVVLHKDVAERTETVRDTVRRTDVEIDRADGGRSSGYSFDEDRDHYRTHHGETFSGSSHEYGQYEPAYRYGIELANHPDYRGRDWSDVSATAREHWERQNGDTWSDFEPAARYGYERAGDRNRRT